MSEFDNLPTIFYIARKELGKNHLTYEEYLTYVEIWKNMNEELKIAYLIESNAKIQRRVSMGVC